MFSMWVFCFVNKLICIFFAYLKFRLLKESMMKDFSLYIQYISGFRIEDWGKARHMFTGSFMYSQRQKGNQLQEDCSQNITWDINLYIYLYVCIFPKPRINSLKVGEMEGDIAEVKRKEQKSVYLPYKSDSSEMNKFTQSLNFICSYIRKKRQMRNRKLPSFLPALESLSIRRRYKGIFFSFFFLNTKLLKQNQIYKLVASRPIIHQCTEITISALKESW